MTKVSLGRFAKGVLAAALIGFLAAAPAQAQSAIDPPGLDRAIAAKDFHVDGLMATDGVVGVGVGLTARGQAAIVIMTEDLGVAGLPRSLDGVPVVVKVTGKIHAINKPDANGNHNHGDDPPPEEDPPVDPAPTDWWPREVPIGVSTGNYTSCSAGTIGARVKAGTAVYALSNNHVYALGNNAALSDYIVQPGVYDTDCNQVIANIIGTLADFEPILFDGSDNTIDAAIALTDTNSLGKATPSDGYGTPSSATVLEYAGLSVQKYGRTTRLTKGTVIAINATVNVGYSAGTARFVDQIVVEGDKGGFLKAGDSGSLLVTNDQWANPVGLLFAGNRSGKLAVANNIDVVLNGLEGTLDAGRARQELVGPEVTVTVDDGL